MSYSISTLLTRNLHAHVTQRVGPSVQLAHHGAYAMAVFPQGGDGRVRRRSDAAGGAGDEDGFLGHDFFLTIDPSPSVLRLRWATALAMSASLAPIQDRSHLCRSARVASEDEVSTFSRSPLSFVARDPWCNAPLGYFAITAPMCQRRLQLRPQQRMYCGYSEFSV